MYSMPYMYAHLPRTAVCMPLVNYMYAVQACLIVCLICMPYMYALYVCSPATNCSFVRGTESEYACATMYKHKLVRMSV